jgi:hypothetical protein
LYFFKESVIVDDVSGKWDKAIKIRFLLLKNFKPIAAIGSS